MAYGGNFVGLTPDVPKGEVPARSLSYWVPLVADRPSQGSFRPAFHRQGMLPAAPWENRGPAVPSRIPLLTARPSQGWVPPKYNRRPKLAASRSERLLGDYSALPASDQRVTVPKEFFDGTGWMDGGNVSQLPGDRSNPIGYARQSGSYPHVEQDNSLPWSTGEEVSEINLRGGSEFASSPLLPGPSGTFRRPAHKPFPKSNQRQERSPNASRSRSQSGSGTSFHAELALDSLRDFQKSVDSLVGPIFRLLIRSRIVKVMARRNMPDVPSSVAATWNFRLHLQNDVLNAIADVMDVELA